MNAAGAGGRITTHVLDTAAGKPAAGMTIELYLLFAAEVRRRIGIWTTNADGRTDAPLLAGPAMEPGEFELLFDVAGWREDAGFYDVVPIRFRVHDVFASYHVPLILSPYGYSTYRGS